MTAWRSLLLTSLLAALPAAPLCAAPAGDAARGRALLLQRQDTGCILCHQLPGLPGGGELGPPLRGLAQRYSPDDLRVRIADARRFNPETIMPPYLSTEGLHNVARQQLGRTVLSEQALADIVAWLLAEAAPGDGAR
jgi:L-cysteine S-thiosulfotransferase